ncbi:MAG: hypothetical protein ACRBBN_19650 [Methyloligellaceae bacterium]
MAYWTFYLREKPAGISALPPKVYQNKPVRLIDHANYLQKDDAWGKQPLGNTSETLARVGCTLSSVAMALRNMGYDYNPGTLNTHIRDANGYTENGWFKWASVGQVTDGQAQALYYEKPTHQIIDQCLRKGQYPIIKFRLTLIPSHWVIITGRTTKEYLVRDPLVTSANPIPLSSRAKRILSVRCIGDRWLYHP